MDQEWWREYRRAFAALIGCAAALIAAVSTGYALAQADPIPPASAVTPAPSGTGKLGRAPIVRSSETRKPPVVNRSPRASRPSQKPRHRYQPSPSTSPAASPTPAATSTPPLPATPEPSTPEVSPSS